MPTLLQKGSVWPFWEAFGDLFGEALGLLKILIFLLSAMLQNGPWGGGPGGPFFHHFPPYGALGPIMTWEPSIAGHLNVDLLLV